MCQLNFSCIQSDTKKLLQKGHLILSINNSKFSCGSYLDLLKVDDSLLGRVDGGKDVLQKKVEKIVNQR